MSDKPGFEKIQMLEQYKVYVEAACKNSILRSDIHKFYALLLLLLMGGIVFLIKDERSDLSNFYCFLFCVSLFGVFLCMLWIRTIEYYKSISEKKFPIIHEMEEYLPFKCFQLEWARRNNIQDLSVKDSCMDICGCLKKPSCKCDKSIDNEKLVPKVAGIPFIILCLYSFIKFLFTLF
ncbi:RipA family octameric membrane protein [Maridesulfovibrio zosterae]|uniref:RipA family octameric membrane protein n=1 Tax=Maridesulfovibrio zosterae TaxID=82171 RepID=UPI00040C7370|nr:hypothetical protein [Maridesulfovibrio zosterae]